MKTFKKVALTILGVVGIAVAAIALPVLALLCLIYMDQGYIGMNDVPRGYYEKQEYFDKEGFQDYTDYCKYYYTEEYDEKFAKNKDYSYVNEEDIPEIISYFEEFEGWMLPERANEYDFDKSRITVGDYVRIDSEGIDINFDVYFYDVETHILYYIHNNI